MSKTFDSARVIEAQKKYCEEHGVPMFAPANGICFRCGCDIYSEFGGYSVEYAGVKHITGCPFCNATYCD